MGREPVAPSSAPAQWFTGRGPRVQAEIDSSHDQHDVAESSRLDEGSAAASVQRGEESDRGHKLQASVEQRPLVADAALPPCESGDNGPHGRDACQ